MKENELINNENKELKSLIKEKNENIVKLSKTVKDLQSEVTKMKNESSIYFRSKTQA
jgi:prefoldin subunit 5